MTSGVNPNTGKSYRFKDRTGCRNGRLIFTRCLGETPHRHMVWEAQCDCGNITKTSRPHQTKSCGCLQREAASKSGKGNALPEDERIKRHKEARAKIREKRKKDPVSNMQIRLSRLHRFAIAQVGAIKTSPTFEELGYTPEDLIAHLEKQFVKGMGWHNMDQWQIDHITPVSTAKTLDDVVSLNQLWNLRPMWAHENNAKKDNIEVMI